MTVQCRHPGEMPGRGTHGPGPGRASVEGAFEHRILQGLAAEWEHARGLLPEPLRRSVNRPLFAIRDMRGRLGCWSLDRREIALSREMVVDHRWDDIRDVLLHEMAHQVADEGFAAADESDHGSSFRQACHLLGAHPQASGRYRSLHARLRDGERLDDRDRMVVKIRKLMALADSSNRNEAHAAMRKAYQLIARHNIDRIDRRVDQAYASIFLGAPRLRHFREAYHLAHLLQDFYFVQGVWVQAWVLAKNRMGRVLEISGTPKNILIADYVHDSVNRYIDVVWDVYRTGKRLTRHRKTDFAVGVIQGFRSTLVEAAAGGAADNGGRLPAIVEDQALNRYVARRYPHLRSAARRGAGHDGQVLADGRRSGERLIIAKGITRRDGFADRMLEYVADPDPRSR